MQKSTKKEGEEAFGKGMKMIRNHVTDQLLTGFCPSPLGATTAVSIGDQLTIIPSRSVCATNEARNSINDVWETD